MKASASELYDATRQAEQTVDKAYPGVDADRRNMLMMAYAIDRSSKFFARDGADSGIAAAFLQVAADLAAPVTTTTMALVAKALEAE